jgi:hypothetical protein
MRGEMQSMTAEVRRLEREEETAFNYLHLASFSALSPLFSAPPR